MDIMKIKRRELNFSLTFTYFKEMFEKANTLSISCLELMKTTPGKFFTYVPSDLSTEQLHQFKFSIQQYVREFAFSYLHELAQKNPTFSCIFDDFNCNRETVSEYAFFKAYGRYINQEIYYILDNNNSTISNIEQAFRDSDTTWHSLGIISETSVSNGTDKELTVEEVEDICLNARYVFVTAYDGEGCIFWKKNEHSK